MGDAGSLSNKADRGGYRGTHAGGELLNIIAMLGTLDNKVPEYIALESFVVGRYRQAL
jgi:hypothetical protein